MKIEKLEIEGLYGYINKEIHFFDDINLLVGINGSGKTSILNLLNWIIRPSLPDLCVTEFKRIKLTFCFEKLRYFITCKHKESTFSYEVESEKESFHPLTVPIEVQPNKINNDEHLILNLIQSYSHLKPDYKEKKTWDLISKFPNPTVIGLDRNLYSEEAERIYIETPFKSKNIRKSNISSMSPLQRVKEIVNTEYRKRKNSILNLMNGLKNQLMLSTFDENISLKSLTLTTGVKKKLDLTQIEAAETKVYEHFKKFEIGSLSNEMHVKISKYFSKLKKITLQYQENPNDFKVELVYGLNAIQFAKVNKLLIEFKNFEENAKKELKQIDLFLETVNYFFKDSSKKLTFKEDTFELVFNALQKDGKTLIENIDINFLSSGEQQMLILFSYIAFISQGKGVFLIDEPELSLHIKWQENFLFYLEKITPKATQLILATHSPILAGKKKDKAIVLLPFNV